MTAVEILGGGAVVTVTPAADRDVAYRARFTDAWTAPTVEESLLGGTLRLTPHCPGAGRTRGTAPAARWN
ncbi:hypothetical protein AB0D46_15270 [Streptomyces sp. NPDC048383]|uniref:hypothetical protein n=1 Tax=Streptomyces sp. NPDC048383 TaxID=3155386 RepID=UPI0034385AB5